MRPDALDAAIAGDLARGVRPVAVVATIGTTSTTSADPVDGDRRRLRSGTACGCTWTRPTPASRRWCPSCGRTSSGGSAPIPSSSTRTSGCSRRWTSACSIAATWTLLRAAFSLVPDFLKTAEGDAGVRNLMDTGIQLGRRFRSLKLWMVLRGFGAEGIRAVMREHLRLARLFASWVDADPRFERVAPVPFSVVCFRVRAADGQSAAEADELGERLMERVNETGEVFLSHTRLDGRFVIRLAIGHYQTAERHVARAWELLQKNLT